MAGLSAGSLVQEVQKSLWHVQMSCPSKSQSAALDVCRLFLKIRPAFLMSATQVPYIHGSENTQIYRNANHRVSIELVPAHSSVHSGSKDGAIFEVDLRTFLCILCRLAFPISKIRKAHQIAPCFLWLRASSTKSLGGNDDAGGVC